MDNNKDDIYYLEKMKNNFERTISTMNGISYDEYVNNIDIQDITMFNLIQISENVKNIFDEYKKVFQKFLGLISMD